MVSILVDPIDLIILTRRKLKKVTVTKLAFRRLYQDFYRELLCMKPGFACTYSNFFLH